MNLWKGRGSQVPDPGKFTDAQVSSKHDPKCSVQVKTSANKILGTKEEKPHVSPNFYRSAKCRTEGAFEHRAWTILRHTKYLL